MNTKTNAVTGESKASRKLLQDDSEREYECNQSSCGYDGASYCSNCGYAAGETETLTKRRSSLHFGGIRGRSLTKAEEKAICAPSFEDIQAMAGFPVDSEGRALVVDEEENDDDTRTVGLPANEDSDEEAEEAEEPEESILDTPYRLRDEGRNSDGTGESFAERNA